jgi:mannose-6-phosphate isomerase-like protein (cupin superfamily)
MASNRTVKRGGATKRGSSANLKAKSATARARAAGPKRRAIKRIDVTPAYMEKERVARYGNLRSSAKAFIDTRLPNGERDILNVIGRGVVEDAALLPPIKDNKDFNVAFIRAKHGCGATLHIHETNEVFIPLKGDWGIFWQNKDGTKHEVVLHPYDTVSVPIGLSRGFRYAGKGEGLMLAVVGGTDPGRVHWPKETVEEAKKYGFVLRNGDLVELPAAAE